MWLALLALAGCWTGAAPQPSESLPSAFEITLERTECLVPCPMYKLSIDGDGRIRWTGIAHVEAIGERRATVPPRRIRELQQMVDAVEFYRRDPWGKLPNPPVDREVTICADGSSARLTVRTRGRAHTITNNHCEDSPIDELEALVDDIARTSAWIGERVLTH